MSSDSDRGDDAESLLRLAETAREDGRMADALHAARQAHRAAAGADPALACRAGLLLAHCLYRNGALGELVEVALEILPVVREHGGSGERFDLLRQVALCGSDIGRFGTAIACAREAQAMAIEGGDLGRQSLALNAMGACFERMGDSWQAEQLMHDALALARQQDEPHALFISLNNLCAVLIGMFHLLRDAAPDEEARAPLRRGLPFAREAIKLPGPARDPLQRVVVEGNLGEMLLHLGELAEAHRTLDAAMALSQQIGAEAQTWRIGCSLGELALLEGDAEAAWQRLDAVRLASSTADARMTHLRLHHALSRVAAALQRPEQALQHLQQYLTLERRRSMRQLRAQSELFVSRAEVEQMRLDSRRDELTRLGNRREAENRWPALLSDAESGGAALAVAMLDLDNFKQINDRFGHAAGDAVLRALAGLLRENTRSADLAARVGGEEFLLVLPGIDADRAHEVCERLRQRVAGYDWGQVAPGLAVTLSIGLTAAPPYDAERLTATADAALYRAKAAGRNRIEIG